jgi:hypothetical protein
MRNEIQSKHKKCPLNILTHYVKISPSISRQFLKKRNISSWNFRGRKKAHQVEKEEKKNIKKKNKLKKFKN